MKVKKSTPVFIIALILMTMVSTIFTSCGILNHVQASKVIDTAPKSDSGNNDHISSQPASGSSSDMQQPSQSSSSSSAAQTTQTDVKLVPYNGPIYHIFFHPLLAYPDMAFDGDSQSNGFDDWFVTVSEFEKIVDSLYNKNYMLIDINSLYEEKTIGGKKVMARKELLLPENKKPLILSIDDMNYYKYMIGNGTVNKLILDSDGNIATYSINEKGEEVISRDNEIVPIVDKFVEDHPDFSLNGAKGIISITGFQGVLGYRTELSNPNNEIEREEALMVIKRLKETGWTFASHGYGHLDAQKSSYNAFAKDTQKWIKEVESLTGPTQVYIYPFGASLKKGDPKLKYLMDSGFKIFCGVGPNFYERFDGDAVLSDRRHIDGIALRHQQKLNSDLYDASQVIDPARPKR